MLDFENANEVFDVYGVYPHKERGLEHMLLGRFLVVKGKLHILEDHEGLLKRMLKNGPVSDNLRKLDALANSTYTRVVPESEVTEGKHIDLLSQSKEPVQPSQDQPQPQEPPEYIEEQPAPEATMQLPPAIFQYMRVGMVAPQTLEVRGDDVYMNGYKLDPRMVQKIFRDIQAGLGKLRYKKEIPHEPV